jgi:P4 family phage/plasmid primase-like protien
MTSYARASGLDGYLSQHAARSGSEHTHTRIGDKSAGISGGSYNISTGENEEFLASYYQKVFVAGKLEHLTEKQLVENGPILVDVDLRFDTQVTERQHTDDHLTDLAMLYADKLAGLVNVPDGMQMDVFMMEKQNVKVIDIATKDGVHMLMGAAVHKGVQAMLRDEVLKEIGSLWEGLPITNTWEDVLDEGVAKGHVNWQLYGSRKPGHEAYLVKQHHVLTYEAGSWSLDTKSMAGFKTKDMLSKLSARYTGYQKLEVKEEHAEAFKDASANLGKKGRKAPAKKAKLKLMPGGRKVGRVTDIDSMETLDAMIADLIEDVSPSDYKLKETHQFTMCLPESYYGPGSYNKWWKTGAALANTDHRLFLTWLKFSAQPNCRNTLRGPGGKFDWSMVADLYSEWQKFDSNNPEGLTSRSIMFWAKNDAAEAYAQVRSETVDHYVDQTVSTGGTATEWDLASVLHQLFKDKFVCVSISKNIWYECGEHRWHEIDSGNTLRLCISSTMHQEYLTRIKDSTTRMQVMEQTDQAYDVLRKRTSKLADIAMLLKKTQWKNNIMREARELFYDREFMDKLDCNPYLMCFNNGVVDFKSKCFRKGQPDDYLSMCTNIDYKPLDRSKDGSIVAEIETFFEQLFPVKELRRYVKQHLASSLLGLNLNQTLTKYLGTGRNGKSALVDLMSHILGEYKGTVPITMITAKRNNIGSTSSEIAQLKGVRYAVMQEPSKGDRINEGVLKEITGGDPIQARALFKDTITFIPQFTLVCCTNVMLELNSTDDGTLRRFRLVDFQSKFLENPYEDEIKFPKAVCPYQYKLDKNLASKFETWAPVLMAMLVEIAYEKQGIVDECNIVVASTEKYRESQDYLAEFSKEHIGVEQGGKIKKTELYNTFKDWYQTNHGRGVPKAKEVYEFMNGRYGHFNGGWHNVKIIYDDDDVMDGV